MASKTNKASKAQTQTARKPYTDKQRYLVIRGNGKGTYAEVTGTEALYQTAQHGYVSKVYKANATGDPIGRNMLSGRTFKNGRMSFNCPIS